MAKSDLAFTTIALAFFVCINASACTYWISDGGRKKSSVAASATYFCIIYFNYAIIIVLLLES